MLLWEWGNSVVGRHAARRAAYDMTKKGSRLVE